MSLLLLIPTVVADDNPTIAILRFGPLSSYEVTEGAILDFLQTFEWINADERAILDLREDLEGENINIIWGDAGFDFGTVNLMVGEVLDQEPDVLLTISLPVMQIAVNATLDMEDPPAVLFTSVYHPATQSHEFNHPDVDENAEYNPFAGGTAESSCLKPGHVSGVETETTYPLIVPLLLLQNPDMKVIGMLFSSSELSGVHGAEDILETSSELGLTVEHSSVVSVADLALAAEGLIAKGVEAFLIPADIVTIRGIPILTQIAIENGIPLFHSTLGAIYSGATVGAGSSQYYTQGIDVSRILIGYLNGEVDIATTGIYVQNSVGVGVNLDSAEEQGIELSEALRDEVDVVIENGQASVSAEALADPTAAEELRRLVDTLNRFGVDVAPELLAYVETLQPEDLLMGNAAFLERLYCSPERIAEEQAALDAAMASEH